MCCRPVLGALLLLLREDWRVGLVAAIYILLAVALLRRVQKLASRARSDSCQAQAEAPLTGSLTFIVGYSAFMLVVIATLAIGAGLFLQGLITIGSVYLLLSYVNKLYEPVQEVQRQVAALQRSAASVGRVSELLEAHPRVEESVRAVLPSGPLGVVFDSGKTTLTRLLFRLYDPTAGTIRLGGADVREVGLSDLRRRVGMVTQDVQLFRASVRDNLTFFNRRVPDERILAVLEELGLWAWHESLADGLDTVLEAGGKDLSAGQAQLLAFARVFLRDPGLVILDEASSRLDPATERLLERVVDRLLQGRTAIIVAHRLATVQRADEILVLENGRVREHGDRRALAADPASRFYCLLQSGLGEVAA